MAPMKPCERCDSSGNEPNMPPHVDSEGVERPYQCSACQGFRYTTCPPGTRVHYREDDPTDPDDMADGIGTVVEPTPAEVAEAADEEEGLCGFEEGGYVLADWPDGGGRDWVHTSELAVYEPVAVA